MRVAWNNIFIIDPAYTVPLLACVAACLFLHRTSRRRRAVNYAGLILTTGYLVFTFVAKYHAQEAFAEALDRQDLETRRCMTCPTPLNTVLWYGVAEDEDGYYVGFHSLLDSDTDVEFRYVSRREDLLMDLESTYDVDRLTWFADGYYAVRPHRDGVVLHVMKFGSLDLEGEQELYPFSYLIYRDEKAKVVVQPHASPRANVRLLASRLWQRLKGT